MWNIQTEMSVERKKKQQIDWKHYFDVAICSYNVVTKVYVNKTVKLHARNICFFLGFFHLNEKKVKKFDFLEIITRSLKIHQIFLLHSWNSIIIVIARTIIQFILNKKIRNFDVRHHFFRRLLWNTYKIPYFLFCWIFKL